MSDAHVDTDVIVNLDFGDAMLVATVERRGDRDLYSYDRDFDRITSVDRLEP